MNRTEALHILGLEDDATADDIKIAYRETVQILHPDKFAGNEKLQSRATEQFKRLQEAYDLLSSGASGGRGGRGARSGSSSGASSSSGAARAWTEVEDGVEVEYLTEAEIKARLAGHRPPPAPSWWPSAIPSPMSAATAWPWRPLARWPRCSPSGGLSASSA